MDRKIYIATLGKSAASVISSRLQVIRKASYIKQYLKNLAGFTRKKYRKAVPFIKELARNYLYEKIYTIEKVKDDDDFELPEGARLEHRLFKLHCPGRFYELDSELVKKIEDKVIVYNYPECRRTEWKTRDSTITKYNDRLLFGRKAVIVIEWKSFYYLVLMKSCDFKLDDLFEKEVANKLCSAKEFDHYEVILAK